MTLGFAFQPRLHQGAQRQARALRGTAWCEHQAKRPWASSNPLSAPVPSPACMSLEECLAVPVLEGPCLTSARSRGCCDSDTRRSYHVTTTGQRDPPLTPAAALGTLTWVVPDEGLVQVSQLVGCDVPLGVIGRLEVQVILARPVELRGSYVHADDDLVAIASLADGILQQLQGWKEMVVTTLETRPALPSGNRNRGKIGALDPTTSLKIPGTFLCSGARNLCSGPRVHGQVGN